MCEQDEKEKKRLEQLERKKELQRLADEEMSSLKGAKANPTKVTRALIQANQEQLAAEGQLGVVDFANFTEDNQVCVCLCVCLSFYCQPYLGNGQ